MKPFFKGIGVLKAFLIGPVFALFFVSMGVLYLIFVVDPKLKFDYVGVILIFIVALVGIGIVSYRLYRRLYPVIRILKSNKENVSRTLAQDAWVEAWNFPFNIVRYSFPMVLLGILFILILLFIRHGLSVEKIIHATFVLLSIFFFNGIFQFFIGERNFGRILKHIQKNFAIDFSDKRLYNINFRTKLYFAFTGLYFITVSTLSIFIYRKLSFLSFLEKENIDKFILEFKVEMAFLSIVIFVIFLIFVKMMGDSVGLPLKRLANGMRRIQKKDYSEKIPITTISEFNFILGIYNEIIDRLKDKEKMKMELVEKRRIDEELEFAHLVQEGIVPNNLNALDDVSMSGYIKSANIIGGDFFDYIKFDEGKYLLVISDAAGKGIVANIYSLIVHSAIKGIVFFERDILNIVKAINSLIFSYSVSGMFVTAFFALFDFSEGKLEFVNAGHCPPVLISGDGEYKILNVYGKPLGVSEDCMYQKGEIGIKKDDLFIFYTDGLIEAKRIFSDEEFGENRVIEIGKKYRNFAPDFIINKFLSILERYYKGSKPDDITLVVMKIK